MIDPYASGDTWTLYKGDSLAIIPHLVKRHGLVDNITSDPPYSSGGAMRGDRTGQTGSKSSGFSVMCSRSRGGMPRKGMGVGRHGQLGLLGANG